MNLNKNTIKLLKILIFLLIILLLILLIPTVANLVAYFPVFLILIWVIWIFLLIYTFTKGIFGFVMVYLRRSEPDKSVDYIRRSIIGFVLAGIALLVLEMFFALFGLSLIAYISAFISLLLKGELKEIYELFITGESDFFTTAD